MKPSPTIEEHSEAFRQHLAASEYLYKEAVAALAVGQAIRHLRPDILPPPRRSVPRAPGQLLRRVGRNLRDLVLVAIRDRRSHGEGRQRQIQSDSMPIVVDFPIEPLDHPAHRFDPHVPWAVVCPPEIQTGDEASGWSVIRSDDDNREKGADDE